VLNSNWSIPTISSKEARQSSTETRRRQKRKPRKEGVVLERDRRDP